MHYKNHEKPTMIATDSVARPRNCCRLPEVESLMYDVTYNNLSHIFYVQDIVSRAVSNVAQPSQLAAASA
eukprot:6196979-Pleurochrysis_carterae.AAC.6